MGITRQQIKAHLYEIADSKYKEFHGGLVPGCDTILGVRVPVLRRYAKELLKEASAKELLQITDCEYYEEIMLRGMFIGLQQKPQWETVRQQIVEFVPYINNWAVCDTFCAGLKITKKHKGEMFQLLQQYLESELEFECRFGVVMLLDYYVEKDYLPRIFQIFDKMNREGYYVQMAVAWAVSVCLVKAYEQTIEYLKACHLDDFTYNKALQKARESYRITPEQKETLNKMKR